MNRKQFKIALLARDKSVEEVAKIIGISPNSLYTRLQGRTQFTLKEMLTLRDELALSEEEFYSIFLNGEEGKIFNSKIN